MACSIALPLWGELKDLIKLSKITYFNLIISFSNEFI